MEVSVIFSLRSYALSLFRTPLSFSWDALGGAANALERLWKLSREIAEESKRMGASSEAQGDFLATMRDDLATAQALSILWESLKSEEYTPEEKWGLLEVADTHLGLSLLYPPTPQTLSKATIPNEVQDMLTRREVARNIKDFKEADRIRDDIERCGYRVEDGSEGQVLTETTL